MRGMNKKVYIWKEQMVGNDHVEKKMDKISNLPKTVIDAILIRLPLEDAVRTSILSRQWRQKWLTMSQLLFDKRFKFFIRSKYVKHPRIPQARLVNTVDQILYRHQGSLCKFELHLDFRSECHSVVDRWVLYLSTIKGIKEIILWMDNEEKVLLNGIFSCKELIHLELKNCTLELPSTFEGFPNLKCLLLDSVNFYKDEFSILLDKCPLLERLKFKHGAGTECVAIDAPMLQSLSIGGFFSAFSLQNTPLVHTASISFWNFVGGEPLYNCNLFESLCRLPNLRTLKLKVNTLMYGALKLESIPKRFTTTLYSLKSLEIEMDFENAEEIFAALCLLRSSPNLCKLKIGVCDYEEYDRVPVSPSNHWNADEDHMDCLLNNLVKVRIRLLGICSELEFIKVVLANSPKLQKMTLKKSTYYANKDLFVCENAKFLKELIQFKRASPDAEILCI